MPPRDLRLHFGSALTSTVLSEEQHLAIYQAVSPWVVCMLTQESVSSYEPWTLSSSQTPKV